MARTVPRTLQTLLDTLPAELEYLKAGAVALYWEYRRPEYTLVLEDMNDAVFRSSLYAASDAWDDPTATAKSHGELLAHWLRSNPAGKVSVPAKAALNWIQGLLETYGEIGLDRNALLDVPDTRQPPFTGDWPEDAKVQITSHELVVELGRPRVVVLACALDEGLYESMLHERRRPTEYDGLVTTSEIELNGGKGYRFESEVMIIHANDETMQMPCHRAEVFAKWPGGLGMRATIDFGKASAKRQAQAEAVLASLRPR